MRAKDVLLEALQEFTGTVVFVSHDRYFIDKLATRVFEVADGGVNVYPGNYEDYLWRKANRAMGDGSTGDGAAADAPAAAEESRAPAAANKRLNPDQAAADAGAAGGHRGRVARLEAEIAGCEAALSDFKSVEETLRVTEVLKARREELERLLAEWEEVATALEAEHVRSRPLHGLVCQRSG